MRKWVEKLTSIRKIVSIAVFALAVVSIITVWFFFSASMRPEVFTEDFENGFRGWVPDAQVPEDPNNPGNPVFWEVERSDNLSASGQYSVQFLIDGRQDDGTVWIERSFALKPESLRSLTVSFQLFSGEESFNTIAAVVGYVGKANPESESDFRVLGPANQVSGWKTYSFSLDVETGSTGEVYVAVGISVRWETYMSYLIDDLKITVY